MFGFVAMNSMQGEDHSLCLATIAQSVGCVASNNPFSLDSLHTSVFQSFSMAVMTALALGLVLLLIFLSLRLAAESAILQRFFETPVPAFQPAYVQKFVAWIKHQEKRDPAS